MMREWRKNNGFQETRNALTAAIQYIERIRGALQDCMPQIEPCGSKNCSDKGHNDCPYGVARRALAEKVPRVTFPVRCFCKRCGNTWHTRVGVPVKCPKCKSKLWNKDYERNPKRYARMRRCAA
jgi:hypothetical protein